MDMSEITPFTIEKLPTQYASWYREGDPNVLKVLSCGDDRPIASGGDAAVHTPNAQSETSYIRHFGGGPELAMTALKALAIQGKEALVDTINPLHLYLVMRKRMPRAAGILPVAHSDIGNEGGVKFNAVRTDEPIGCARLQKNTAVMTLAANNLTVITRGEKEYDALMGTDSLAYDYAAVAEGIRNTTLPNRAVQLDQVDMGRGYLARTQTPVIVLEGSHLPPAQTFVSLNFTDLIAEPGEFYGVDVKQTTEAIMQTLPEFDIDPHALIGAILHDACATRAALAHDPTTGVYDPSRLKITVLGDPLQAADELVDLRARLRKAQ